MKIEWGSFFIGVLSLVLLAAWSNIFYNVGYEHGQKQCIEQAKP